MVAVAVLPLTLTSVGEVVVAEPEAPEVVTSLTSPFPLISITLSVGGSVSSASNQRFGYAGTLPSNDVSNW